MRTILAILLLATIVNGCGSNDPKDRRSMLPSYIGRAGEVLVIMEKKYWEGRAGEVVRDALLSSAGVLPQYEPACEYTQFPPEAFDRLLRPHRNIIYVEIKDNIHYKEPRVQVIREKYAKEQILVNCQAMTETAFVEEFGQVAQSVIDKINEAEVNRQRRYNERFGTREFEKMLAENHGIALDLLPDLKKMTEYKHFLWLHRITARPKDGEMHDVQQGIIVYDYPYVNDSTFTRKFLMAKRDSVLKKYMHGPAEGSYMTTEYFYEPEFMETSLNGKYAVEIRGLYKMNGAFMGGPFISMTTFDEARGRIVTAEGFVFAPKFDKREYLREVEAVVKSLSFAVPDTATTQTNP